MQIVKPITAAVGILVALAMAQPSVSQVQDTSSSDNPWGVKPPVFGNKTDTSAELAADTTVIRQAITGNLLEVRLGDVARDRADDDAVEDFAQEMVEDHGSMQRQWSELARKGGVPVEARLEPVQEATVQRIESFSGAEFDRAYITTMIQNHERDLATLQRVEQSARSSEVRRLAATDLAAVEQHLTSAREVGKQIGVSNVAALPPSRTPAQPDDRVSDDRVSSEDRTERRRAGADRGDLSSEDRYFVREVLQDHLTEIRLAERARREAKSEKTRDFAEELAKDWEKWQKRWEAVASRHGLEWNANLGRLHRQKLEGLEKANGQHVDRVYAAIVVEHLGSIVPYFQKEGKAVRSEAVRRLVEDELPSIRKHLARARQLQQQANARADASKD